MKQGNMVQKESVEDKQGAQAETENLDEIEARRWEKNQWEKAETEEGKGYVPILNQ